eukprot:Polyplicarium_translucidae@DN1508_c0_g1_i1.p1
MKTLPDDLKGMREAWFAERQEGTSRGPEEEEDESVERPPISIEVIREGAVLHTVPLTKEMHYSMWLAGSAEAADIRYQHPSVSKEHALLRFDDEARKLYLYDLNSTNGTCRNQHRLPAGVETKVFVGDHLAFGDLACTSTRFLICGPEEMMPPELDVKQCRQDRKRELEARQQVSESPEEELQRAAEQRVPEKVAEEPRSVYTDHEAGHLDVDRIRTNLTLNTMQKALCEKVTRKLKVLEKLQKNLENTEKGAEKSMTSAQAGKLDFLNDDIERAEAEAFAAEDALSLCLGWKTARAGARKTKAAAELYDAGLFDEGDEFYDRSLAGGSAPAVVATAKRLRGPRLIDAAGNVDDTTSLGEKLTALVDERAGIEAQREAFESARATEEDVEDDDPLEAFMRENQKNLDGDERRKMKSQLADVDARIEETELQLAMLTGKKRVKPTATVADADADGAKAAEAKRGEAAAAAAAAARIQSQLESKLRALTTPEARRAACAAAGNAPKEAVGRPPRPDGESDSESEED